jgi:hypothetical protein
LIFKIAVVVVVLELDVVHEPVEGLLVLHQLGQQLVGRLLGVLRLVEVRLVVVRVGVVEVRLGDLAVVPDVLDVVPVVAVVGVVVAVVAVGVALVVGLVLVSF